MSDDVTKLLEEARDLFQGVGLDFAVIGGCARNAYSEPRATKDVDFVVEVNAQRYGALTDVLRKRGFWCASSVGDGVEAVPDLALYRDANGRRIDLLFAHTSLERSALRRSERRELYAGITLPIVSPEDLILYKLIADRPQDRADIAAVIASLASAGRELDWSYIEEWAQSWDVGDRCQLLRSTVGR